MNTTAQITSPLPLHTRDSSSSLNSVAKPADLQTFGYTFTVSSEPTSESRHDRRLSSTSFSSPSEFPPAYSESHRDVVPSYSQTYEPTTLAMYLFRFGFLFPPFWIMGVLILITPLRAPPSLSQDEESTLDTGASWLPEKTDAEKQAFISHMRKAELKWAKRCLIAFLTFAVVVGVAAGLAVWAISK